MGDLGGNSARGGHKFQRSWARVVPLAGRQFGVVSLAQLEPAGFTYKEIRGLAARGILHRLFRGVFAVGTPDVGAWGWLTAAFLAGGPSSFLSHRAAAAALGLRGIYTRSIELTIRGGGTKQRGLIVHRATSPPDRADLTIRNGIPDRADLTIRNGIPVSAFPRMLIELAPTASRNELDHLITMAARKGILDVGSVEEAFVRHARRPGVALARETFAAYRPRPDRKSGLEREFDEELDHHPDIPKPQTNVFLLGRFEADCYWPEHRLVVELDGRPYHIAVRDIGRDAYKDGQLLRAQIRTLRIKDARWELDRAGCMEDVRSLLGLPPR